MHPGTVTATDAAGPPAQERLQLVEQVLDHQTRQLIERAQQVDEEHFRAGLAWAIYALERVRRAAHGVADRELLGLAADPLRPPAILPTTRSST